MHFLGKELYVLILVSKLVCVVVLVSRFVFRFWKTSLFIVIMIIKFMCCSFSKQVHVVL